MGLIGVQRIFSLAFLIAIPLEAITVPICPTNKIAPHRRIANWDYGHARTLGAFYDLLAPESLQFQDGQRPQNDLVEKPQEDDPDDCGEIEDYDENDLSSITSQVQRRQSQDKTFFPGSHRPSENYPSRPPIRPQRPPRPENYPTRPPIRPQRPPRPDNYPTRPPIRPQKPPRPQFPNYAPTKSPFWSGGFFGMNEYRPPMQQYPSDNIKPIHENLDDSQEPYRPSIVGGPSGHIIGASPARPNTNNYEPTTSRPFFPNRTPRNSPERTTMRPYYPSRVPSSPRPTMYLVRGQRPRNMSNSGILGSFADLLFK